MATTRPSRNEATVARILLNFRIEVERDCLYRRVNDAAIVDAPPPLRIHREIIFPRARYGNANRPPDEKSDF